MAEIKCGACGSETADSNCLTVNKELHKAKATIETVREFAKKMRGEPTCRAFDGTLSYDGLDPFVGYADMLEALLENT